MPCCSTAASPRSWRARSTQASARPVTTLLSGPAAGVIGAMTVAEQAGFADCITLDVGGTSADICLVRGGRPEITKDGAIGAFPLKLPMLDIHTIGAGGGSIAVVSAADPLNLVGILTPDQRVTAIARSRILFRDGVAIAAWEGGEVRRLAASDLDDESLRNLLSRRVSVKTLKPHFRTPSERERQMLMRKRTHAEDPTSAEMGSE